MMLNNNKITKNYITYKVSHSPRYIKATGMHSELVSNPNWWIRS